MSDNDYTIPEPTEPTPVCLAVYGNNASVACPCGRIVVVRSMNAPGTGAWKCACTRWYKGYPEDGQAITHILVWNKGSTSTSPSLRVKVEVDRQA